MNARWTLTTICCHTNRIEHKTHEVKYWIIYLYWRCRRLEVKIERNEIRRVKASQACLCRWYERMPSRKLERTSCRWRARPRRILWSWCATSLSRSTSSCGAIRSSIAPFSTKSRKSYAPSTIRTSSDQPERDSMTRSLHHPTCFDHCSN